MGKICYLHTYYTFINVHKDIISLLHYHLPPAEWVTMFECRLMHQTTISLQVFYDVFVCFLLP